MNNLFASNDLNNYIKIKIGESKSKEEEDKYVSDDVDKLKDEIKIPSLPDKKQWEIILRVIYADMLGHDTRFVHAFIVNCVQNPTYKVKRIAYIACNLLLDEDSPFRIMMVASIQKDLSNKCLYNRMISLNALPKMICPLNATAFIELINKGLLDPQPIIRKKSLLALLQLEKVMSGAVEKFNEIMEKALRDTDPSVMMVAVPYYLSETKKDSKKYRHLFDVFVKILTQILEKKLSKDYEYENYGAPWVIVSLMQILGILNKNDQSYSEKIYPLLTELIKGFFVILTDVDLLVLTESISLVLSIYPNEALIQLAVDKMSLIQRSLVMKKQDRQYMVLTILFKLVEINPSLCEEHQLLLVDSLESSDETIKQLTVNVLFQTVSESNLSVVCQQIEAYLQSTIDFNIKIKTCFKYFDLLQNHSPNDKFFLQKSLVLLSIGGNSLPTDLVNKISSSLQEIVTYAENDCPVDNHLEIFENHFKANQINDPLVQLFSWYLGSYVNMITSIHDLESFLISSFEHLLNQTFEQTTTLSFIYSGLHKIKVKLNQNDLSNKIDQMLEKQKGFEFEESNVRIREYLSLKGSDLWKINEGIDCQLRFLENFVKKQVFKGAKVYNSNARNQLSKPLKTTDALIVKYSKEQLESNMKKIIQNTEAQFVYKGSKKWKEGEEANSQESEIQSKNIQQDSNYSGINSEDYTGSTVNKGPTTNKGPISKPTSSLLSSTDHNSGIQTAKQKNSKLFSQPEKKSTKLENRKNKIASSLFGETKGLFGTQSQSKNNFFSKTKPNDNKQSNDDNDDILNLNFTRQHPANIEDSNQKLILTQRSLSVEDYEKQWGLLSSSEYSWKRETNKNVSELVDWLKHIGCGIVDVDGGDIICAVGLNHYKDFGLLYACKNEAKLVDFTFRGDVTIKNMLIMEITKLN